MLTDNVVIALLSVTLIMLIFIIGIIIVIARARKQKMHQELKEVLYKSKINNITLAALRAQMNPHFIFNCLNSIKLYTEQNNSATASEYLDKFSKLIRNMLDGARCEVALLSNEIDTLQLYLEMEALRFKNKLRYSITIDKNVETDFVEIPPLLIQPYVENAIWHGIMQKTEGGNVDVHISQEGNTLSIAVKDDGIGRAASEALKGEILLNHKSHGSRINESRIALLNESNNAGASITTTDLYDNAGQPAGTLVTILLPLK
jgi:LytS/YehU family sensor histidine kinase